MWKTLLSLLCAACLFVFPSIGLAQQTTPSIEQVVSRFYPAYLADDPPEAFYPSPKEACYVVYDRLPNGSPKTLIAGYTDGLFGALRVLQAQANGTFSMVSELNRSTYDLGGNRCDLAIVNLGGDNAKAILYSTYGSRGGISRDWYFRWDGAHFVNLGPTQPSEVDPNEEPHTVLISTGTADLDGNGILSIIGIGEFASMHPDENGLSWTGSSAIYKFSNGTYAFDHAIALFSEFFVGGVMQQDYVQFREDPANQVPPVKEFILRVINGPNYGNLKYESGRVDLMQPERNRNKTKRSAGNDQSGDDNCGSQDGEDHDRDRGECKGPARVKSAQILINGVEVVAKGQINSDVGRFETRVKLTRNNTILVNLEGKHGAGILIILDPVFDSNTH